MSKAKNASVNVQANSNQYAFWLIAASIIAYLGVAPFFKALFNGGVRNNLSAYIFNQPIYAALIFTFLLSLCFGCFLLVRGQLALLRGTAIPLVLVWLLPVTYLITLWASAVSTSQTIHAIVIQCMYAFFFMFAIFLARSDKGSAVLATAIMGVGYVIVIFGFLNWFGTHIYRDAVTLEPGRLRLTSVFQYANAYAAFLIALLLASLYLLIRSHQRIVQIITAAMIVPTFLSLILTFSRASALAFAAGLTFIALVRYRKLLLLMLLAAALILALPQTQGYVERFVDAFTAGDLATQMRIGEYIDSLRLISQYPVFGVGFTGTPSINLYTDVASMYLIMANEIGLVGVGLYLLAMGGVFAYGMASWRHVRNDPQLAAIHLGYHAALLTALVNGVADHYSFRMDFQGSILLFWVVVALALASSRLTLERVSAEAATSG